MGCGRRTTLRRILTGAVVGLAMILPASASAALWSFTPKQVSRHLVAKYQTHDGVDIAWAYCRGVWSAPHARSNGAWYFHKLNCAETDAVNRAFLVHVTAVGPYSIQVFQYACSDRYSDYSCPSGLQRFSR